MKEEGNQIYIITSRHLTFLDTEAGHKMRNTTLYWLNKYKIPNHGVYFSKDKTVEIQKVKLDLMIEDSPKTIPIFAKYVPVFCFDCI